MATDWRTGHKAPGTTYAAQGVGNKLGVLIGSGVTTLVVSELEQGRYHPNAKYAPHSEA